MTARRDESRLPPPEVASDLPQLGPVERAAEVLRYGLALAEHCLAPDGSLRRRLKRCLSLAVLLVLPLLVILPLALLLASAGAVARLLVAAAGQKIVAVALAIGMVLVFLRLADRRP